MIQKKIIRVILGIPIDLWLMFITYMPGKVGFFLRVFFWKKRLKKLGKNVRIDVGVYFQNPNYVSIDDNCWIDRNVMILAGLDKSNREKIVVNNKAFQGEPGYVYIGKNVHIGPFSILSGISAGIFISNDCGFSAGCRLFAFSNHYRSKKHPENENFHFGPLVPPERQCLIEGAINIGINTGVALNAIILPGVSIPENCFITINSVVKPGRYKKNSIISGNLATVVNERFKTSE